MMAAIHIPVPAQAFTRASDRAIASVAGHAAEMVSVIYCDAAGRPIGQRDSCSDMTDAVDLPVRRIVIDALALDAAAVVIAHNHPSGEAWPSRADWAATRQIATALAALGVRLHDHWIVADGRRWSFREAGLL